MWIQPRLDLRPSEYFQRQGYVTFSDDPVALRCLSFTGAHSLLWGSDYPHPEGSWPVTRQQQYDSLHGLPEDEIALLLGGNAIDFYGLDAEKLAPIAARIGPEKGTFKETSE